MADDALGLCVVCRELRGRNHHCGSTKEKRIESARIGQGNRTDCPINYGTRLQDGFAALGDGDYYDG